MTGQAENAFFQACYRGRRVLVLVPHQDDEINVAGNAIRNFVNMGAEVFVAFSTNGDFEHPAEMRMQEAEASLGVLGVPRERIVFLGYGDTLNGHGQPHVFYVEIGATASPAGHRETYGAAGFSDYAWQKRNAHSAYCRKNYLRDLRDLLLDVSADIILCVDCDWHADHRMLSLEFDAAMGEILSRPGNAYCPEVFKRFAYALAFTAVPDFFAPNLLATARPEVGKTGAYPVGMVDSAYYSWAERVRFPIPPECRGHVLRDSLLARALLAHRTQHAITEAVRILNSDEVFWPRRTDSLSYQARVSATSGKPDRLKDFRVFSLRDIDADLPVYGDSLWRPATGDGERAATFTWATAQSISLIRLYGSMSESSRVEKLRIVLDNGACLEAGPMPFRGQPLDIRLKAPARVRECRIQILSACGEEYGLSECEFFSVMEQPPVVRPFIKITLDGNFAYDYDVPYGRKACPVGVYRYRVGDAVRFSVLQGAAHIDEGTIHFDGESREIVLRAEVQGREEIYDQVVIHRRSRMHFAKILLRQARDRWYLRGVWRGLRWRRKKQKLRGLLARMRRWLGRE